MTQKKEESQKMYENKQKSTSPKISPKKTLNSKKSLILDPSQPSFNLGLVGHVDHGKTTLVQALSGKWTANHSEELKRGITIRLGYANFLIFECPKCQGYEKYSTKPICPNCNSKTKLIRTISLVDAPGHESLMATMLSGSALMNGALLLIAANEKCPQPQTKEHLMALSIVGIKNMIVVQNKIDTVSLERAKESYQEIKNFLKDTEYKDAPIIPISAQHNINIDVLLYTIERNMPSPKVDLNSDPQFFIARSFDINSPGSDPRKLSGGVLGGVVKKGVLKVGDIVEIKPGFLSKKKGREEWKSLTTTIISIKSDNLEVERATPGGSYALMTTLDPAIVKSDSLSGSLVGLPKKLPEVYDKIEIEVALLERVVGLEEDKKIEPIKLGELLMLNVNTAATVGIVSDLKKNIVFCNLKIPICAEKGSRITISRRVENRFRLIGYGILK